MNYFNNPTRKKNVRNFSSFSILTEHIFLTNTISYKVELNMFFSNVCMLTDPSSIYTERALFNFLGLGVSKASLYS